MANAEAMAKANEKRVSVLERKFEAFEKATRAAGDFSTLEKRVSTLESLVKALAASTKSGGGSADGKGQVQIGKDVEEMKRVLAETQKAMGGLSDRSKPDADRLAKLQKQDDMLTTGIKTLTTRQEKHKQEQLAAVRDLNQKLAKQSQEVVKQSQEVAKATVLETRLRVLEAQVQAALAK